MKILLLLVILSLSLSAKLQAQAERIKFNHISLEQGLSQSAVTCILQDSKGFMWFGTHEGLNKFAGYGFMIYNHDPENNNSLSNNWVFSIYEDQFGVIWIGTSDGLNKFDPDREQFTHYFNDPSNPYSLSNNEVWLIHGDQYEYLGLEEQLKIIKKEDNRFLPFVEEIQQLAEDYRMAEIIDMLQKTLEGAP